MASISNKSSTLNLWNLHLWDVACRALAALAAIAFVIAPTVAASAEPVKDQGHLQQHDALWEQWDNILQNIVENGLVDYSRVPTTSFNEFIIALKQSRPAIEPSPKNSSAQQMAYWINAYNALTIELILNNDTPESIKDIGGWFSGPCDVKVLDELSLDDIEHNILRPMGKPGIHFAINCASMSCPPLRQESYRAESLATQLEEQKQSFIHSRHGVVVEGGRYKVSKIFKWFDEDWGGRPGVIAMLQASHRDGEGIKSISYLPYDWSLNNAQKAP